MMHGRKPVAHLWPMNHCLAKVDISDPHTFLAVKRGILQYTWMKPMLAIATIAMKATGTYQEGYIGLTSGYFWSGLIYNISITISLYALALFWVCMSEDLQPFRPMPKFLCIKGIIFASYWQGFFLSILVWLGAIPDLTGGYSADNLAAAIQDALICFEMPLFAIAHWYAFSWHDYADKTISDARMPVKYALRDAFGPRDLIEDAKETFYGTHYDYRWFDAKNNVMAHEQSSSREARMREGMRYGRGGKGKYWLPERGHADAKTPLLGKLTSSRARTMSPGGGKSPSPHRSTGDTSSEEGDEPNLDPEEERLYTNARSLEFGDWNYPVINTHYANRDDRERAEPNIITASTNRSLLQPSRANRARRKSRIKEIKGNVNQGKHRESASSGGSNSRSHIPFVGTLLRQESSSAVSTKSHSSQLVDLVVEDHEAEEIERVRARKEGGPGWNENEQKHFVYEQPNVATMKTMADLYAGRRSRTRVKSKKKFSKDSILMKPRMATLEQRTTWTLHSLWARNQKTAIRKIAMSLDKSDHGLIRIMESRLPRRSRRTRDILASTKKETLGAVATRTGNNGDCCIIKVSNLSLCVYSSVLVDY